MRMLRSICSALRRFRTGRLRDDGLAHFVSRVDGQVRVQSFRRSDVDLPEPGATVRMDDGREYWRAQGPPDVYFYIDGFWDDASASYVSPQEYHAYMSSPDIRDWLEYGGELSRWVQILSLVMLAVAVPVGVFLGLLVGAQIAQVVIG